MHTQCSLHLRMTCAILSTSTLSSQPGPPKKPRKTQARSNLVSNWGAVITQQTDTGSRGRSVNPSALYLNDSRTDARSASRGSVVSSVPPSAYGDTSSDSDGLLLSGAGPYGDTDDEPADQPPLDQETFSTSNVRDALRYREHTLVNSETRRAAGGSTRITSSVSVSAPSVEGPSSLIPRALACAHESQHTCRLRGAPSHHSSRRSSAAS